MFTPGKDFRSVDPRVRIGNVQLKVSDLERALQFYCGVLGFELMQRWGTKAAFVSAGGYHHHIGLNTWESLGGPPPPPGTTGLFHLAILYPDRASLGDALRRLLAAKIALDGASDHGVSEALYLHDPDYNGLEIKRFTDAMVARDRKSTRLNSSHANISYAVFCLKKKKKK